MLLGTALRRVTATATATAAKSTTGSSSALCRIAATRTTSARQYATVKPLPPFMRKEAKEKKREAKEAARKARDALPMREVNSSQGKVLVRTKPIRPFRPRELRRQGPSPISHNDPNRPRRKLLRVGDAERSRRIMFPNVQIVLVRNAPTPSRVYNPWIATFRCSPQLAKPDIVSYLQNIYGLEITSINTTTTARVIKRNSGGKYSRTSNYKKAIVGLKQPFWYPEEKDRLFLQQYFGISSKKMEMEKIQEETTRSRQYDFYMRQLHGAPYGAKREAKEKWRRIAKALKKETETREKERNTLDDEVATLGVEIELGRRKDVKV